MLTELCVCLLDPKKLLILSNRRRFYVGQSGNGRERCDLYSLHLTYFSVKKQQLCRSMLMMMTTSTCKEVGIHLLADYLRLVTSLKLQKEENFLQH